MEWKPVIGYEGLYEISNSGEVSGLDRVIYFEANNNGGSSIFKKGMSIKPILNDKGYFKVSLCKNNKPKSFRRGRLVAIHFIDNPLNLPEVNHKHGNKLDNRYFQLEWQTKNGNMAHASATHLFRRGITHPSSKTILNTQTGIFYDCIREAAESCGLDRNKLKDMLRVGRNNSTNFIYA